MPGRAEELSCDGGPVQRPLGGKVNVRKEEVGPGREVTSQHTCPPIELDMSVVESVQHVIGAPCSKISFLKVTAERYTSPRCRLCFLKVLSTSLLGRHKLQGPEPALHTVKPLSALGSTQLSPPSALGWPCPQGLPEKLSSLEMGMLLAALCPSWAGHYQRPRFKPGRAITGTQRHCSLGEVLTKTSLNPGSLPDEGRDSSYSVDDPAPQIPTFSSDQECPERESAGNNTAVSQGFLALRPTGHLGPILESFLSSSFT